MARVLMPENISIIEIGYDLKRFIQSSVKELPEFYTVLVIVKSKSYYPLIESFLDIFINDEKLMGIYITTNRASDRLVAQISKDRGKSLKLENVFFVDCMRENTNGEKNSSSCAPQDLTAMNLIIEQKLKEGKAPKFLIMDSLSTFFIYNEPRAIEKFVRSAISKLNANNAKGVFITTKTKANEAAIDEIGVFFDKVIEISS